MIANQKKNVPKAEAWKVELICGHTIILGSRKPKRNTQFLCPQHGSVGIRTITDGKIEPYFGFVSLEDSAKT